MSKGRKTDTKTLIEILDSGPKSLWGADAEEQKCIDEAKRILVSQDGTEDYRKALLEALLYFTRSEAKNDGYNDASNEND